MKKSTLRMLYRFFLYASLMASLVLMACGSGAGASQTPQEFIESLERVIQQGDAQQLEKMMMAENHRIELDEHRLQPLLDYFDAYPEQWESVKASLNRQADRLEEADSQRLQESMVTPLKLVEREEPVSGMRYAVIPLDYNLYVKGDIPGTIFFMNKEEVSLNDKESVRHSFHEMLPGRHRLEAVYSGEYIDLRTEKEVDLFLPDDQFTSIEVSFDPEPSFIYLRSNVGEAELYINDENTGVLIKDIDKFGPYFPDGSLYASAGVEYPWGLMKSQSIPLEDQVVLSFEVEPFDESVKQSLMETLADFRKNTWEAVQTGNDDLLEGTSDHVHYMIREIRKELEETNQIFTATLEKMVFDWNSLQLIKKDTGELQVSIIARDYFYGALHPVDETSPSMRMEQSNRLYILSYPSEEQQWFLEDMDVTSSIGTVNTSEWEF
ncbi:TcaA 3rd/4th domain-containing protein [Tindallia californiensis]|nr:hypothetical protein [Tindallia californiensis]